MNPQPPEHTPADSKAQQLRADLRQTYKARRDALTSAERTAASAQIAARLLAFDIIHPTHTVAAFAATPSEVDLHPWMTQHLSRGGRIALPRVGAAGQMEFHRFNDGDEVQNNRFGIAEPHARAPLIEAPALDVVLVPLVAFDPLGHRLGMGGGFYDRYLPRLTPDTPLIGVAFACQQHHEALPSQAWDVPLHAVVTETAVLECQR